MNRPVVTRCNELSKLCNEVKRLVHNGEYDECKNMIINAMAKYPDAPQPHNLLGVVLEKELDHLHAMKHFRAALALDETYLPARENLRNFGTFYSNGKSVFDENDCEEDSSNRYEIKYDDRGIGHVCRRG